MSNNWEEIRKQKTLLKTQQEKDNKEKIRIQSLKNINKIEQKKRIEDAISVINNILEEIIRNSDEIKNSKFQSIVENKKNIELRWGNKEHMLFSEKEKLAHYNKPCGTGGFYIFLGIVAIINLFSNSTPDFFRSISLFSLPILIFLYFRRSGKLAPEYILSKDYNFISININRKLEKIEKYKLNDISIDQRLILPLIAEKLMNPEHKYNILKKGKDYCYPDISDDCGG